MTWTVEWDDRARRELRGLDEQVQQRILHYLRERVSGSDDPRGFGHALKADLSGLWRYRVGDYRLICRMEDERFVVLVVWVGHRREVYR